MAANNILKHYGIKGMKWGIRKEYEPVGDFRNGPYSNAYVNAMSKSALFNIQGVRNITASSVAYSTLKKTGSNFSIKWEKTKFTGAPSGWKSSGSKKKGGGGKKGSGSKAKSKVEKAQKEKAEKVEKQSKKSGGGSKKAAGSSKKASKDTKEAQKEKDKKEQTKAAKLKEKSSTKTKNIKGDSGIESYKSREKMGNTKFDLVKDKEGNTFIISDDGKRKWSLPKEVKIDPQEIGSKIEKFETELKQMLAESGYKYSEDEYDSWLTSAMNKMVTDLKGDKKTVNKRVNEIIAKLSEVNLTDDKKDSTNSNNQVDAEYEDESNKNKIEELLKKLRK